MFTITPASPADLPSAAQVMASAFQHDTVMSTLITGGRRRERLASLFEAIMRSGPLRTGRIDLARRDVDGALLGVAIWEAPNTHQTLRAQMRELPLYLQALGWRGLRSAIGLQRILGRHRPAEPHWYLAQIGVSADARGAGVGSALLETRLCAIDAGGAPAYLESSNERNRALYRRWGFQSIAPIAGIEGASPAAMWRAVRRG